MILHLTNDERDYLIRMLGGPSEQGTRTLGVGLTGQGVLAFRQKVERAARAVTVDCSPGQYFDRDAEGQISASDYKWANNTIEKTPRRR